MCPVSEELFAALEVALWVANATTMTRRFLPMFNCRL